MTDQTSSSGSFSDRLLAEIARKGSPVCVGLDPLYERIPDVLRASSAGPAQCLAAIETFCREVLEVVSPIVPAVKFQIAYFEIYRGAGLKLYFDLIGHARRLGLIVIGDTKRNDIGSTARAYAAAHLAGVDTPDAITVNGYLGSDGLVPFIEVSREQGKGIFVLVRTSNPSSGEVQDFADSSGKKLYEHVAEGVAAIGAAEGLIGAGGYSCVGAVVGATYPDEARRLRELMGRQIFLVPGYGAQGATAGDCAASFKPDGTGAIVNASRSVIYAHTRPEYADVEWTEAVAAATRAFAGDIQKALTEKQ